MASMATRNPLRGSSRLTKSRCRPGGSSAGRARRNRSTSTPFGTMRSGPGNVRWMNPAAARETAIRAANRCHRWPSTGDAAVSSSDFSM